MRTRQSRYEALETVATRVIAAAGSFNSARGIDSQTSVGAAVDEERWPGNTQLLASVALAQSEQFERFTTYVVSNELFWNWNSVVRFVSGEVWFDKGFVIWHFRNYCSVQFVLLQSLSIGDQIVFTTNELVDSIKIFKWNASPNDEEEDFLWKKCTTGQIFYETKCAAGKTSMIKRNAPQADFFEWVLMGFLSF